MTWIHALIITGFITVGILWCVHIYLFYRIKFKAKLTKHWGLGKYLEPLKLYSKKRLVAAQDALLLYQVIRFLLLAILIVSLGEKLYR
jgi:hypothetical protein